MLLSRMAREDLGETTELVCKAARVTHGDIAVRAGYHRSFLDEVIEGETPLTEKRLERLCEAMERIVDEFDAELRERSA